MSKFPNLKKPSHIVATLGGVGNAKYAPGTWGSLVALLCFIFISHQNLNIEFLVAGITIFAVYISEIVSVDLIEKDHKAIVIDELAGMWIAAYPAIHYSSQDERIVFVVLAFILFRIFDITKPFPISYIDRNIKGGLGIVLDDVVAGLIAALLATGLMNLIFG